jgi:rod shape-determining protein MreB
MQVPSLLRVFAAGAGHDVAVDLGTANVRVYAQGRGMIADEPSVVRVSREPRAIVAVGAAAACDGGPPSSFPVRPLRRGVVRDAECAGWLLAGFLRRARGLSLAAPSVLACAPSDASADEIECVRDAVRRAGASRVTVVPEPLAAAVGAGMDMASPYAQMIVDVGEGVTDVAVIRDGRIEASSAARVGCADLRAAVADRLAATAGLCSSGSVEALVRSADAEGGEGAGADALAAMGPVADAIASVVRSAWADLPARASCEVIESGIWTTGGGSCLRLVRDRIARVTSIDLRPAHDPLHAVIAGAGRMASAAC